MRTSFIREEATKDTSEGQPINNQVIKLYIYKRFEGKNSQKKNYMSMLETRNFKKQMDMYIWAFKERNILTSSI